MKYSAFAVAFAVTQVAAHATWQQLWVNGVDKATSCVRMPQGGGNQPYAANFPVTDVSTNDFRCNVSPGAAQGNCAVAAGDTITVEMHQGSDRACGTEGIGGVHWGPISIYLSKVSNAATDNGSGDWFKIYESSWAQNGGDTKDYWGTKDMNFCCGKTSFGLPSNIPSGDYLLRAEALALHAAGSYGGYQFYMSCYQLTVSGGSGSLPSSQYLVKFPGAYKSSDPGIGVNIHTVLSGYTAPGPAVIPGGSYKIPNVGGFNDAKCAASSTKVGGGSSPATTSAAAVPTTTSSRVTTTSSRTPVVNTTTSRTTTTTSRAVVTTTPAAVTTTASSGGCTTPQWQQCGGGSFSGCTTCAGSFKCVKLNDFYSQCQ